MKGTSGVTKENQKFNLCVSVHCNQRIKQNNTTTFVTDISENMIGSAASLNLLPQNTDQ
jgi:hypothetical protein